MKNCYVELRGVAIQDFEFDHTVDKEDFYKVILGVTRKSGVIDYIPIVASEKLFDDVSVKGKLLKIRGEYRSFNDDSSGKNKLILFVFADRVQETDDVNDINSISMIGYLCKKPILRETPSGRTICDVIIAVNRTCNKSDYIPCIAWGRNATFIEKQEVGTCLELTGRIQSREYVKRITDEISENRITYEVSVSSAEKR